MEIRKYRPADCPALAALFFDTVHSVNAKEYTREQLDAWAPEEPNQEAWNRSFLRHCTLVAVEQGQIVGFGDIEETGYLDRLYVHKEYQGLGIASALCEQLEAPFLKGRITTQASITARPFFEKRGYRVLKEQTVERRGIKLKNYRMQKG